MSDYRIERFSFDALAVGEWAAVDTQHSNWPVVYTIDNERDIYVGESLNGAARMRQHLGTEAKQHLKRVQVIVDDTFNKSACLDLESHFIRLFAGDGKYRVLNRNDGISEADYYRRGDYQEVFDNIFEELRAAGYFTRSVEEIQNSDLFKFSPFKALTQDQAIAVEDIMDGLIEDLHQGRASTIVVQGEPGTGKTILAIYIMKLLGDLRRVDAQEFDRESMFADLFTEENRELLRGFRVGIVVPQQSLRATMQAVFSRTPGLDKASVLTPFDVGRSTEKFDLLIVDEAHRLNRRSAQAMGTLTRDFGEINRALFGSDGENRSQLDWITHQSTHQIFLVDSAQAVRPADLPRETLEELSGGARAAKRFYPLTSQMRVRAGSDYVGYVRRLLERPDESAPNFGEYDLRLFADFDAFHDAIMRRDREVGLSRVLAGYAWEWKSRKNSAAFDIELGTKQLQWNTTSKDWINSSNSVREVGSIHTVQGYDLNYAGVIIGGDLKLDPVSGRTVFDRATYFDRRGKSNNNFLGQKFTDEDLLEYVRNIYGVLLSRGMLGTYVYVCDPALRQRLAELLPGPSGSR